MLAATSKGLALTVPGIEVSVSKGEENESTPGFGEAERDGAAVLPGGPHELGTAASQPHIPWQLFGGGHGAGSALQSSCVQAQGARGRRLPPGEAQTWSLHGSGWSWHQTAANRTRCIAWVVSEQPGLARRGEGRRKGLNKTSRGKGSGRSCKEHV